jgi:glycerol uptake facilitator-like aquaporin
VTIARVFTDTFAGIAPASVAPFILAQLVGAALGLALLLVFYPAAAHSAGEVVVPAQPESTS